MVLDTVAKIRKCGLESILSLPQLVVCGDQSTGKSSVLEALTEIPFPRNVSIGSPCTEGKHRMRTLSILTIKKGSYLYIREVSEIEKGEGYVTETEVVV